MYSLPNLVAHQLRIPLPKKNHFPKSPIQFIANQQYPTVHIPQKHVYIGVFYSWLGFLQNGSDETNPSCNMYMYSSCLTQSIHLDPDISIQTLSITKATTSVFCLYPYQRCLCCDRCIIYLFVINYFLVQVLQNILIMKLYLVPRHLRVTCDISLSHAKFVHHQIHNIKSY